MSSPMVVWAAGTRPAATRVLAMLGVGLLGSVAVTAVVRRPLSDLASGVLAGSHPTAPLPTLVVHAAAVALVLAWAWLVLTVAVTALTACRGVTDGALAQLCPAVLRRVVLALLGCSLATTATLPALALPVTGHDGGRDRAQGLVSYAAAAHAGRVPHVPGLPDTAPSPGHASPPTTAHDQPRPDCDGPTDARATRVSRAGPATRVAAGDTLWAIAERHLPPDASGAEIDRGWRRIAALNAAGLPRGPHLLTVGTVLRLPPAWRPTPQPPTGRAPSPTPHPDQRGTSR